MPEAICLIIFQLPFALMMLILYPRNHYVLGFGAILFALAVVLLSRRLHRRGTRANGLIVAAVLSVIVPNLGAVGARVDAAMGEWSVVPRPALQTAYFLRRQVKLFAEAGPADDKQQTKITRDKVR